LTSGVSVSTQ